MRRQAQLGAAALALLLAGCGMDVRYDAAEDVRALLVAAETGDKKAFEAHIDRPAVKASLRQQVIQAAQAQGIDMGGPSEAALDRMIAPDAFKLVRPSTGGQLTQTPSAAQIALMLDVIDKRRTCLREPGGSDNCILTFEKQGKSWKLVGVQASDMQVAVQR